MNKLNGIENLVVGEIYTYPQLCKMFGDKQRSGPSRVAQLKNWYSFFRWSNPTKQKYLIEEIYAEPIEIIDGRRFNGGNPTGKFYELDDLIVDALNSETLQTTITGLAIRVGLLSENYKTHRRGFSKFAKVNGFTTEFVGEYMHNINSHVIRAFERSMERLVKSGHIAMESEYLLVLKDRTSRVISVEEIRDYEEQVKAATKINPFACTKTEKNSFYEKVCSLISEELGLSVSYYYKRYSLQRTAVEYEYKTKRDIEYLTRKFVYVIVLNMISFIYKMANQVYAENPIRQEVYLVSADYDDEEILEMIRDTVSLSHYYFVHMDKESWNAYWEELKSSDKEFVFLSLILMDRVLDKEPRVLKAVSVNDELAEEETEESEWLNMIE